MNERILERAIGGGRPASLTDDELELDLQPITRTPIPRPVRVWLRYSTGPVLVEAEAVAWTEHAVLDAVSDALDTVRARRLAT